MVFQNKSEFWKFHRATIRGASEDSKEYYGEEWSPSPFLSVPIGDQESPKEVWLVFGPYHGNSYTQRSRYSARVPWKLECPGRHRGCPEAPQMSQESWLKSQEELCDTIKGWCLHFDTMVAKRSGVVVRRHH